MVPKVICVLGFLGLFCHIVGLFSSFDTYTYPRAAALWWLNSSVLARCEASRDLLEPLLAQASGNEDGCPMQDILFGMVIHVWHDTWIDR